MKLSLGAKIILLTLVLSLIPIVIVTGLNVRTSNKELAKVVQQDLDNMLGFVSEILTAHESLVKEAEIGDEVVWILQAREQEKEFIIKEDEASIKKWHALIDQLKQSSVYVGDVPESIKRYEAVFSKFIKGMLADLGELARAGAEVETQVRKWVRMVKTDQYQEEIKVRILGPKSADGTRDMSEAIRIGATGFIYFMKPDGTVVGHPGLEGRRLPDSGISTRICQEKDGFLAYKEDGREKLAYYKHFKPWDWIIVIDAYRDEVMNVSDIIKAGMMVAVVFAVLVAGVAIFFARSLTKPIDHIVRGLTEGANGVASAAAEVESNSQALAHGASQQAAALEETSSSLEEMAAMTRHNADNSSQGLVSRNEVLRTLETADQSMTQMMKAMENIRNSGEQTSKIIKTIDEIAFQTNLLALNAAVEAARAGEAGAGFAVVADEVRNLAMRSAEAARNTQSLIEKTVGEIKEGSQLLDRTAGALKASVGHSNKLGGLIEEIAAASEEQAKGIEQINKAVVEMDKVTQQNAAGAEESASLSEEMSAQAKQMKGFVGELAGLIGGRSARINQKSEAHKQSIADSTKAPSTGLIPEPRRTAGRNGGGEELYAFNAGHQVRPEAVIPFDDGDF